MRLHVLSAYGTFESERISVGSEEFLLTNEQEAEGVARDVFVGIRKEFPSLEITFGPAEGNPGEALVKAAENLSADVIVVGNKRVQGMARILGSIARDVAAHAPCDVYVAHNDSIATKPSWLSAANGWTDTGAALPIAGHRPGSPASATTNRCSSAVR